MKLGQNAEDTVDGLIDHYHQSLGSNKPDPIDHRHLAEAEKGANVLIVDESQGNGYTKKLAQLLISRFYPDKEFNVGAFIIESQEVPIFNGDSGPPWKTGLIDENYGITGVINPTDDEQFSLDKAGAFHYPETIGFTSRSSSNMTVSEHERVVGKLEESRNENQAEAIHQFIDSFNQFFPDLRSFCLGHREGYSAEFQHYIDVTLQNLDFYEERLNSVVEQLKKSVTNQDTDEANRFTDQIRAIYPAFMENFRRITNDSKLRKWWSNFSQNEIGQEFLISVYVFERDAQYYFSENQFVNAWESISQLNSYRHYIEDKKGQYKDIRPSVINLRREMTEIAGEYWSNRDEVRRRIEDFVTKGRGKE
jgi:hypothetical protein